jgi:type VI protein secretion system component Hcp
MKRRRAMRSGVVKLSTGILVAAMVALFAIPFGGAQAAIGSSTLTLSGLSGGQTITTTSFDASSFSWGVGNSGTPATGGGGGAGKAVFQPLVVKHELKAAEAMILKFAAEGRNLPQAEFVVKAGDAEVIRVTLTNATVVNATLSGKTGQPETSLNYRGIAVTVNGSTFCFDVVGNVAC